MRWRGFVENQRWWILQMTEAQKELQREREREEGKERKRLYKIINYIILIPSSGVKTETVSENGPRPTSVLAAIVNS